MSIPRRLNKATITIVLKKGLSTNLSATATTFSSTLGEPAYTTDTYMLYIFNGTDNLPVSTFIPIETVTANTTLDLTQGTVLCDATSGNLTMTLPALSLGKVFNIKKIDSSVNTVTVSGTIDGAASALMINQYESITLQAGTAEYHIL